MCNSSKTKLCRMKSTTFAPVWRNKASKTSSGRSIKNSRHGAPPASQEVPLEKTEFLTSDTGGTGKNERPLAAESAVGARTGDLEDLGGWNRMEPPWEWNQKRGLRGFPQGWHRQSSKEFRSQRRGNLDISLKMETWIWQQDSKLDASSTVLEFETRKTRMTPIWKRIWF